MENGKVLINKVNEKAGTGVITMLTKDVKSTGLDFLDSAKNKNIFNYAKNITDLGALTAFSQITNSSSPIINLPLGRANILEVPDVFGEVRYRQTIKSPNSDVVIMDDYNSTVNGEGGTLIWISLNVKLAPRQPIIFSPTLPNSALIVSGDDEVVKYGDKYKTPFKIANPSQQTFDISLIKQGRKVSVHNSLGGEYTTSYGHIYNGSAGKELEHVFTSGTHTGVQVSATSYSLMSGIKGGGTWVDMFPNLNEEDMAYGKVFTMPYKLDAKGKMMYGGGEIYTSEFLRWAAKVQAIRGHNMSMLFSPYIEVSGEDGLVRRGAGYWNQIYLKSPKFTFSTTSGIPDALKQLVNYIMGRAGAAKTAANSRLVTIPLVVGGRLHAKIMEIYAEYFKERNAFLLDGNIFSNGSKILTPNSDSTNSYTYNMPQITQAFIPEIGANIELKYEPTFDSYGQWDRSLMEIDGDSIFSWMGIVPSCSEVLLANLPRLKDIKISESLLTKLNKNGGNNIANTYLVKPKNRGYIVENSILGISQGESRMNATSVNPSDTFQVFAWGELLVTDPSDVALVLPQEALNSFN